MALTKSPKRPTENELRAALQDAPAQPKTEEAGNDRNDRQQRSTSDRRGDGRASGGTKGGGESGGIRGSAGRVLDNCPVQALGVRGDFAYFLDALGQLRASKDLKLQFLASLFAARFDYLCDAFPKWRKGEDGVPERVRGQFDGTCASNNLWAAAGECGVFNPDNAVRGVGAWTDDDGGLIYHMGDKVLYGGELLAPGRIAGRIYPAAPALPRPIEGGPDPVPDILETLKSWNWTIPDLHPHVALGMIATQMLCGAMRWRPTFWLTAPASAGKSEFQKMIGFLHGDGALIQSTDATKSGITSRLKQSSLPVALDELEPGDERSNKERDIITLARVASSGGEWSRGSADQSSVGGKVYSAFLFSSILIPGIMSTQDVQRLIRLDMNRIENASGLSLEPKTWRARGARLRARLIERWPSLPERISRYRHALEKQGVTGRNADNWEIVLAMADMAMDEALPEPSICGSWARKVAMLVAADREEVTNDADAMLSHLLGQLLDPFRRGEQYTVSQWIMVAAGLPGAPAKLLGDHSTDDIGREERKRQANDLLAQYGLRIYAETEPVLFIANTGTALMKRLFEGSQWAGGVWSQSARRVPNAYRPNSTKTLAGVRTRGTMLPLASIPALNAFPETQSAATKPSAAAEQAYYEEGDF